jgi:hypothetical protein
MDFWEFLLQQEGDRSWQPIESPTLEIPEGRYRIVARTTRLNTPLEIKITQQDSDSPTRRIQKRAAKTNDQGLVVILPYTRLEPGAWELRCTGDLMEDLLGTSWTHTLQLQTQPIELDAPSPDSPLVESPDLEPSAADSPPEPQTASETTALTEVHTFCLQIPQDTWMIQKDQPLTIAGSIATLENTASHSAPLSHLRIRLFDPQNSKMLFDQSYPIQPHHTLPSPFSCELTLPENAPTYLVLGELALYGVPQPNELPPVLATQAFNVTTELLELLESIANDSPDLPLPPQATVPNEAKLADLDLSFFNIPPVTQTLFKFENSEQNILPPQIHSPVANATKVYRLDLPSFTPEGERILPPEPKAEIPPAPEAPPEASPELPSEPQEEPVIAAIPELLEEQAPSQPLELVDELTGDWDEDWEIADDGTLNWRQTQSPTPATPEDHAFRSLNLQDRFINRLQTLATDPEIADWLREPTAIVPTNPIDREIVVDDESEEEPFLEPSFAQSTAQSTDPIPVPHIEVPKGELISGQPLNVIVRLPKSATRVYAKLWVRDRQLRVLIEGPRWLIDFKPDGFGALKAQTAITLPLGCMDVQFEAIAIDMTTQDESDRAIVSRAVISPELSALSLEELDV